MTITQTDKRIVGTGRRGGTWRAWKTARIGLAFAFSMAVSARAELIEVPAAADTALFELTPDFNFGAQTDLPAGTLGPGAGVSRARVLLRFDVAAALPAEAMVEAAFLRIAVTRVPLDAEPSTFGLHQVRTSWIEGAQQGATPGGAPAAAHEPTWNSRSHPDAAWTEPGGADGVDFDGTPVATEPIDARGSYEFEVGAEGVAGIQGWLADPASNHGWLLRSQDEATAKTARRFAAREAEGSGPVLVIRYQRGPVRPRIDRLTIRDGEMIMEFGGEPGVVYAWEASPEVAGGRWETLRLLPPVSADGEGTATNAWPNLNRQFFRLRAETP
ncbi:MAG: DNRLRE domain-containing protein [Verrucomicrobiales bacterium]|nr:DNRLRE domain-containing protein [Verrucomicrobiales bacterium]